MARLLPPSFLLSQFVGSGSKTLTKILLTKFRNSGANQ